MLRYKIDVLKELKAKGYSTYRIKKENLVGGATIDALRNGEIVGIQSLDVICGLLDMQPGDILEHTKEDSALEKENKEQK